MRDTAGDALQIVPGGTAEMDEDVFDAVTRSMVSGASRRYLVALGLGAVSAILVGRSTAFPRGAADALQSCVQDTDCVVLDAEPCTGTRCDDGQCVFSIVSCAPGYTCCGNGECCQSVDEVSVGAPAGEVEVVPATKQLA
jgi:hypothetical protein